jgi:hypothetical protein
MTKSMSSPAEFERAGPSQMLYAIPILRPIGRRAPVIRSVVRVYTELTVRHVTAQMAVAAEPVPLWMGPILDW